MLRFCSLLVLIAGPLMAEIEGPVRVIDGDTFAVGGEKIRLHGIDAPEVDQMCGGEGVPMWACGAWVSGEVRARYNGMQARCTVLERDRYGRAVSRCFVDGEDVGRALVRDGMAFAYRRYSWDYDLDEKSAAVAGRGLHSVGVQSPAAFRAAGRSGIAAQRTATAPGNCTIKGNISKDGKRIYHMPGQKWYAKTVIRPGQGEKWFCTEAEARQAGWRRAKR